MLIFTKANTIVNIVDIYSRLHYPKQVTIHTYEMFICSDKAINTNKNYLKLVNIHKKGLYTVISGYNIIYANINEC